MIWYTGLAEKTPEQATPSLTLFLQAELIRTSITTLVIEDVKQESE